MMDIDAHWVYYLLVVSNALLCAGAALTIVRAQRMTRQQESFWKSPTGAALNMQPDHEALFQALNQRIDTLTNRLASVRVENEPDSPAAQNMPFENAVRMARHGATMDDLTRSCGLSASEARLLMRVHGRHQPVAQAS